MPAPTQQHPEMDPVPAMPAHCDRSFFQTFIYMWVGGTHFLPNIQDESEVCDKGFVCPGFAIATAVAQAVIFTSVKMWELWQTVDAPVGVVVAAEVVNPMQGAHVHGVQAVVAQAVVAAPAAAVIINPALHNPSIESGRGGPGAERFGYGRKDNRRYHCR